MEYGELAVNYNSTDPVIFIKDSNDNIIRLTNIRPIGDGAINVNAGTGLTASGDNATANQLSDTTRTIEIDSTWVADFSIPTATVLLTSTLALAWKHPAPTQRQTRQVLRHEY